MCKQQKILWYGFLRKDVKYSSKKTPKTHSQFRQSYSGLNISRPMRNILIFLNPWKLETRSVSILCNKTWHRGPWGNTGFIQSYVIILYKIINEQRIPRFKKQLPCVELTRDLYGTTSALLSLKLVLVGIAETYPHPQYKGKWLDYFLNILSNGLEAFDKLQNILTLYLVFPRQNKFGFFFLKLYIDVLPVAFFLLSSFLSFLLAYEFSKQEACFKSSSVIKLTGLFLIS